MNIELPSGVSQDQVKQFLAYLDSKPISEPKVLQTCLNCMFGPNCNISGNCKNEVFEHKKFPSRWLLRRENEN